MNLIALLSGKKTYVVSLLMVLNGIYSYFTGDAAPTFDGPAVTSGISDVDALRMVLEGLGLGTLRAGVTKSANGSK